MDGLTVFRNHAGLMATVIVDPHAGKSRVPTSPKSMTKTLSRCTIRCWRDVGDHLDHNPEDAKWTD